MDGEFIAFEPRQIVFVIERATIPPLRTAFDVSRPAVVERIGQYRLVPLEREAIWEPA